MTVRDDIIARAASYAGTPYALPPTEGTLDCSLYVLRSYADAGLTFAAGVRTAEQIRLACNKVAVWTDVLPGDLLFMENTYQGADGRATHVGISLGAGTGKMWDAHDPGGVQLTDISTDWWQEHLFEARRHPMLGAGALEAAYTLDQLWPVIQGLAALYGSPARTVAAVCYQESTFVNWRVHRDGTGHGLFGLDDNGLLPEAESWAGGNWGRGAGAKIIPISTQIEFACRWFASAVQRYGNEGNAAAVWHRGGLYADELGQRYTALIAAHVRTLFG